ncbi:hypothetical protein [Pseudonocardia abyssalis]|uniref:Lipoprotein n=1 Tax=Pseudonocardia abyssalis TaxID=2792008 RepID=A0ABS6UZD3_9PSEU|nr:hypothetical protein [Pseudonocardia abyssalis]MBW0116526.1 hypothetical protein [Pseudonocardia abyssalis]MBW0137633.1 hypothetical protein [Pseudonocardia abyssalis]
MNAFRRFYGERPLHLLLQLAAIGLAGYAASRVLAEGAPWFALLTWFVGAAVLHDLVFLPVYAFADATAQSRLFRRRRPLPAASGVAWINHLRVPVAFSGLLMLVWFPLILGGREDAFTGATGLGTDVYLGRWLGVTGVLFVGSALVYAVRVRRAARAVGAGVISAGVISAG